MSKIARCLISVFDKTNLGSLVEGLHKHNVEIISTGGTAKFIRDLNIPVKDISDITNFPEMMDGRVKTLHPNVHGGLLARPDIAHHMASAKEHGIESIDLVVVNLYPFEDTVKSTNDYEKIVENIDIGGPSMLRSAAKNHAFKTVIVDHNDYQALLAEMENNGETSENFRRAKALKAFETTGRYDTAIANWFKTQVIAEKTSFAVQGFNGKKLRYGENPQQEAYVFETNDANSGVLQAVQHQGKELSYNNINDADSALEIVREFDVPTAVIVKHANPCGVASASDIETAYAKAFKADDVSAFGGIVALNRPITKELAIKMSEIFFEVILAPSIDAEALEIFAKKKNLRVLSLADFTRKNVKIDSFKSIAGGILVQDQDTDFVEKSQLNFVSGAKPEEAVIDDLMFAMKIVKHVKSNAIVIAKNLTTLGVGAGQMSRIESTKIAFSKAESQTAEKLENAVLASDAFFPFPDSIELISQKNCINAVIQPGGSIKDEEVIAAAKQRNITMAFTGMRHFKH